MPHTEVYREAGLRLAVVRERAGFTLTALAKELGIHQVTLYGYETGNRKMPLDVAVKVAELFDCSVDYLAGRETPPELAPIIEFFRARQERHLRTVPESTRETAMIAS